MAPSSTAPESPPPSTAEAAENNLQPFFVLHKASSSKKSQKKSSGAVKARRRIDLSPASPKNGDKSDAENGVEEGDCVDRRYWEVRMEAFRAVWSKIESTIKDALRDINTNVFNEIHQWVRESFKSIVSLGTPDFSEATRSFPIVTDATSKQLFTGLVFTKNMEFVDDLLTFKELGLHLKLQGCHVANLSSPDFTAKYGIGGCVRSLLRQFLMVTLDGADISVLAAWYREQGNQNNPLVVIIDDAEQCCGSVLSDFIFMLSEWVLKIPVILIMGVATTLDSLRNVLPSKSLHCLSPCKFILGTPSERMDAVVEAVLVKQCSGFSMGHKVVNFIRNYFISQDGTVTSFIRAVKIACARHFSMEPLSFILLWFLFEEDSQALEAERYGLTLEMMLKHAFELPSYDRNGVAEHSVETLVHKLLELKQMKHHWSIVAQCLYETLKGDGTRMLDLLCEVLDPELYKSRFSNTPKGLEKDFRVSSSDHYACQDYPSLQNSGFISAAVRKVRNLPTLHLVKLLTIWEKCAKDVPQICDEVKELLSMLKLEDGKGLKQEPIEMSKRHASRSHLKTEKKCKAGNEKAARLIEKMIRNYMQPIECIALHETVCFKNVDKLQEALIGDPRRRIQVDLLEFRNTIQCNCCSRNSNILLPSMHDTSIMYTLAQEHGVFINLHDWYQSFKSVVLSSSYKRKHRPKYSPSPKKRKAMAEPPKPSEASIQARFCRAVTELQITGLLRMPSKRRPDHVQRVAFGL